MKQGRNINLSHCALYSYTSQLRPALNTPGRMSLPCRTLVTSSRTFFQHMARLLYDISRLTGSRIIEKLEVPVVNISGYSFVFQQTCGSKIHLLFAVEPVLPKCKML